MAIGAIGSVGHNPALAVRTGAHRPLSEAPPPQAPVTPVQPIQDETSYSAELAEERARAAAQPPSQLGPPPTRPNDNVDVLIQGLLGLHSENPSDAPRPVQEVGQATAAKAEARPQEVDPALHGLNFTKGPDKVNVTPEAFQIANPPNRSR